MIFYDFEVFKDDWLGVFMDVTNHKEYDIANDPEALETLYNDFKRDIWVGFNSRHYDQYILKGILCGFNPKRINDYIIVQGMPGWNFSSQFRSIPLNNYDVMTNIDRGLKVFEGFMGNDIRETSVPFDIDRKLTPEEIEETFKYCRHDVEQTIQVFLKRKDDFNAQLGLVRIASGGDGLDLSLISKTKAQLSAIILDATQQPHDDEFEIDFPDTLQIRKYTAVLDWYKDPANRRYVDDRGKKIQLETMIAGVPHQFGWGGVHGALEKYHGEGYFVNMDVASLYPSLMIRYNLHSRNMKNPQKYVEIYKQRLAYKAQKNPLQAPLKLVLNSTYGVMKDKNNALYDPLQANRVCVYGQLLLVDLMEHLEGFCEIIQSNTDGVLVKMPSGMDEESWFQKVDDVAFEWEQRTGLKLEFDEYRKVFQKDVNNYIIVDGQGGYKCKGAYVKKLNPLDYDLPILNRALVAYMVHGVPVAETIMGCRDLKEFQLVSKISGKFKCLLHGDTEIKEKCVRIFASTNPNDAGMKKISLRTGKPEKVTNSPEHCFLFNEAVNDVSTNGLPLDYQWYINFAKKRLSDFGVI